MKRALSIIPPLLITTFFTQSLTANVVAHWRFEGDGATTPSPGGSIAHTQDRTTGTPTGGVRVIDESGNGNTLFGWDGNSNGLDHSGAVPAGWTGAAPNQFSVENDGGAPRAFTWATQSSPSGVNLDTWQPLQWTIEASVYLDPSAASGWRSFLGRDGNNVATGNPALACLYFQKSNPGFLRLEADARPSGQIRDQNPSFIPNVIG